MLLKFSNNNKDLPAHRLFKEAMSNHIEPLQAGGDKGSENRIISKHMVIFCGTQCKGYMWGRSTHNTRIERFWREYSANVMVNFRHEFEKPDNLGFFRCRLKHRRMGFTLCVCASCQSNNWWV